MYWKFPIMLTQYSVNIWLAVKHSVGWHCKRIDWYCKRNEKKITYNNYDSCSVIVLRITWGVNWISFIISNIVVVLFFSVCRPGAFQTVISKSKSSTTSSNRSVKQTWYVLLLYSQRYYWRWRFQSMSFIIPVTLMPRTRPIAISGHFCRLQCGESEPLYSTGASTHRTQDKPYSNDRRRPQCPRRGT